MDVKEAEKRMQTYQKSETYQNVQEWPSQQFGIFLTVTPKGPEDNKRLKTKEDDHEIIFLMNKKNPLQHPSQEHTGLGQECQCQAL